MDDNHLWAKRDTARSVLADIAKADFIGIDSSNFRADPFSGGRDVPKPDESATQFVYDNTNVLLGSWSPKFCQCVQ